MARRVRTCQTKIEAEPRGVNGHAKRTCCRLARFFENQSSQCKIEINFCFADLKLIEIKLTTAPAPEDFARRQRVAALTKATRQVLISRTRRSVAGGNRWSVDVAQYLKSVTPGST
jgi:hypothetical protein